MPAIDTDPLSPRNHGRLFAGMAVQPFVAGLLGFVMFSLVESTMWVVDGRGSLSDTRDAAAAFAFGAGMVVFVVTLFGVFRIVAWRSESGPLTLRAILMTGLVLGNVPLTLIAILASVNAETPLGTHGALVAFRALVIGTLFGLTGAAVFWFVAVRGGICDARARVDLRRASRGSDASRL